MSAKERSKERKNLAKRWAEEQDKSGGGSCVQLPEGVELLKLTPTNKDPLKVDFIPFLAGKNNPRADEGEEAIDRTYVRHWIVGMSGKSMPVSCRFACFGKPCAVCDWLRRNGGSHPDQEFVKKAKAQTRHLWLVNSTPGSAKNPVFKIMDTNDKNKGMGFAELVSDATGTLGDDVDPFDLQDGCTAFIIVKEQTGGDFKYNGATRIDFRPRDYSYPADLIDSAICLDNCIVDPGYDEVMKLLEPTESDEEEERPSRASSKPSRNGSSSEEKKSAPAFEAGDRVEYQGDVHTVKRVDEDDGTLVLIDEDGGITRQVDPEECTMASKPVTKKEEKKEDTPPKKRAPAVEDDDDEEEEDDDDLDDEEEEEEDDEEEESSSKPAKRK